MKIPFTGLLAACFLLALPAGAEILEIPVSADSYIRASQANQGSNNLALIGDTANVQDYLRAVYTFDLNRPDLAGATITGATLRLTADSRDNGSANAPVPIEVHSLSASFTESGVTWTSRDGADAWQSPGADFGPVLAIATANPATINAGDTVSFTSPELTAIATAAKGETLNLIAKLATEDAVRSVFRFASRENSNSAYRPVLAIEYSIDPALVVDPASPDPDFHFGVTSGEPPFSATRTVRLRNDGPTLPLTIESVTLDGSATFSFESPAVPVTLQVGDHIDLTVSAASSEFLGNATAGLVIVTDGPEIDRTLPISAAFVPAGIAPHPSIPGTPASQVYRLRVDGIEVPVNDETYFDFHTAFVSIDRAVEVELEFLGGTSFQSIHPLRHRIAPEKSGNKITFTLLQPLKLVVKTEGALPLAICATPTEENVPQPGDPDVIYYGPGVHDAGLVEPVSGQTVYLAPGALVKGRIEVRNATGVTVRGRGTLDSRGWSVRADKTHAVLFERSQDVHLEGIGIRGGSWWQTNFLLVEDATATHLSLFGKTVNTDGIDLDGTRRFVARHCFIRCEDDGFGWHALDAEANGQPPTEDCLAEDCVIWNTRYGNGLRVGASMETELFQRITFRRIDVLEHAGAAIYSDHSDWALCRDIHFEDFIDETTKKTVDIYIDKTRYSNATGFRDDRGHYDGLTFTRLTSPGGEIRLRGFSDDHLIDNVHFQDCYTGDQPVDGPEDITTNAFVTNVTFDISEKDPAVLPPGSLNLIEPSPLRMVFSWENGGGPDPAAFEIERQAAGEAWAPLVRLAGSARSIADPGLRPDLSYSYRIRALDAAGQPTAWAGPLAATTASDSAGDPPGQVHFQSADQPDAGQILLQWAPPAAPPAGYRLERSVAGQPLQLVAEIVGSAVSWLDHAAAPGAFHVYRLLPFGEAGPGLAALATIRADSWIDAWRRTWFGSPEATAESVDTGDPDRDGRTNLEEYAFGTDPFRPDTASVVVLHPADGTASFAALRPDITYILEFSSDLVEWFPSDHEIRGPQAQIEVPLPEGLAAFARLRLVREEVSATW